MARGVPRGTGAIGPGGTQEQAGQRCGALPTATRARPILEAWWTDSGLCGHRPLWSPHTFTGTRAPRGRASRSWGAGGRPRKGRRVVALLLGFAGPPGSLRGPRPLITCFLAFPPALLPSGSKSLLNPFSHFLALSQASPPSAHLSASLRSPQGVSQETGPHTGSAAC